MKQLLSGNEAIALGAYHAGVQVAAAYPGTPSTEILETLARYPDIYTEWSTNEKVAIEVAMGAAYGGVRAMVSMKHVGLNVAADPFFAASVTGVPGGLVVVSADDPGMHSSQNEQDNRHYARFAKVPMLEPTDSQDAYSIMAFAFQISEDFDTPVMVRPTTRISHCKTVVDVPEGITPIRRRAHFEHNPTKYVVVPSNARPRHVLMEERLVKLAQYAETFPLNQIVPGSTKLGIVSSGVAYQYAHEVFPDASFLKLVLTYPLPEQIIRRFAASVEELRVVEELDPFLEDSLKAMGIKVSGQRLMPLWGEMNTDIIWKSAQKEGLLALEAGEDDAPAPKIPLRPPVLCPGCPHRGTSFSLRRLGLYRVPKGKEETPEHQLVSRLREDGLIATSDIGCYTLAVYAPLSALDTCACMGASIGQALGLEKAGVNTPTVAVIGDSTFMHSGITPLVDVVYNQGKTTVIILDNGTTAMTGHQGHPGTGISARRETAAKVDLEALVRGIGVRDVTVVDAFDLPAIQSTIRRSLAKDEPSVIIARGPCPLHMRLSGKALVVDQEKCNACGLCLRLGCPAIIKLDEKASIDPLLCIGQSCSLCLQVCPKEAITQGEVM